MKFSVCISSLLAGAASSFVLPQTPTTTTTVTQLSAFRQPIMAGNWKMNPETEEEALSLASEVAERLGAETCATGGDSVDESTCTEVVVFPPFPFISKVKDAVAGAGLVVGAQNFFYEDKGAFTGSVSASMVKSTGCEYVLCGHSERRTLFADSDSNINLKVKKTLDSGMKPILCIGETQEEFEIGIKKEVCATQLSKDLYGITKEQMKDVVIAYEPVWAIGTGLVCGAEDANEIHAYCREVLTNLFDEEVAQATRIQYGGSVKPDNVDDIMAMPDIDGCLVGGASLEGEGFARIVNFKRAE
ncbi:Triosephosphate isomerase [Seminavis robusta]|uniref:Triosephosphate isomerase n=1 Tax=Seminavis robusta TaxID=568900 RepID=A0A9N8EY06_9STRA|nr:Triosephosphate isomerase [Seminavis robusta]|eukprot:Sro2346_g324210.1 Triosephosphate isomerase (302) ;mRNA; f:6175-7278